MEDMSREIFVVGYLLICGIVASVASNRGWGGFQVFIICALCSPLIAAILFSGYKKEVPEVEIEEKPN